MAVPNRRPRFSARAATALAAFVALASVACSGDSKSAVQPELPGEGPISTFRPLAFTADVNLRDGRVVITAPNQGTANAPSLSIDGREGPALSLLGGEAVRLIPSNFQASAVGAFTPGLVRVTFDVVIENKLPGIRFITPTWPTPPADGVILFPLEQVVTTTPGGTTGGDGNDIIVELPSYGAVTPSIDWSGTGAAGSGAPFSFFNDADCGLATSNDCFRWEAYDLEVLPLPATSSVRTIGFDLDPTVGQFRARMVVAADLAPAGTIDPATISGNVTSAVRGPLSGVTVNVNGGFSAVTDAAGDYTVTGVAPGTRSVSLANLPAGCTAPAAQTVAVGSGGTYTNDFAVDCTGLPGSISGVVTRSNDGSPLVGVTVTASTGGSAVTTAGGAYSIASAGAGAGTLSVTGAPAECSAASEAYSLASGGSITEDIVVTCTAAPTPGYSYNTTWTDLGGGQIALDLRVDMTTFNRADIDDVTVGAITSDPLAGATVTVAFDATRLSVFEVVGTPTNSLNIGAFNPTVSGQVTIVSAVSGNGRVGNVGVARIIFDRLPGASGAVTSTSTLTSFASRFPPIDITADVRNNETGYTLP
jgi:hypothetical protein